jgi:hypothetical protein
MNLTSSSGTYLKDCLQPQHYYVSISIEDPDGKALCRVGLSYEQAAKMLLYNGTVICTLERYRDLKGNLISEKVDPPESVHQRMKDRLKDTRSSLQKRLEDIRRDVYDMVNGGKTGKTNLKELLNNIETVQSHYEANEDFTVQQAEEELGKMQNNAAGQLGIFLQTHGLEVAQEDLKKLIPTGTPLTITDKSVEPVRDDYKMKQREEKSIDQMTALEVADEINFILKKFEQIQPKTEKALLHGSSASSSGNKVNVHYISYQCVNKLSLEEAREYLIFLLSIKDIKQFKTHHWL